jgi:transcriptional regulator with XRE-family HTH domain
MVFFIIQPAVDTIHGYFLLRFLQADMPIGGGLIMLDNQKIGRTIHRLRKGANMTQSELSDQLGISHQAVSKWENGECLPDIEVLLHLAKMFGLSVEDLLLGSPETANFSAEAAIETQTATENQIKAEAWTGVRSETMIGSDAESTPETETGTDAKSEIRLEASADAGVEQSLWGDILSELQGKINAKSYNTWFSGVTGKVEGNTLVVTCHNPFGTEWLRSRYSFMIEKALEARCGKPGYNIVFQSR